MAEIICLTIIAVAYLAVCGVAIFMLFKEGG